MFKTITAGLLSLLALLPTYASAATFNATRGCEGGKDMDCYFIHIEGEIKPNDNVRFDKFLSDNKITKAAVFLDSIGGEFFAGLGIAKRVQERRFTTVVSAGDVCFSMCAIIWIGGSTRYVTGKAKIGFHGTYITTVDKRTGKRVKGIPLIPDSGSNAVIGAFLARLGLSDETIMALTEPGPGSVLSLTSQEQVDRLGIKVTVF
jgi:hypothetical protein